MDRLTIAVLVASLGVVAGCEAPVEPIPVAGPGDEPRLLIGTPEYDDPVCAARVSIHRETRARVSTGPGNYMLYPDAKQVLVGPGWFDVSEGVSDGAYGFGAQSWVKQFTNVQCSSWSIGNVQMLLLEGSGTGNSSAEARFPVYVDERQRPDAHGHSYLDMTFELERSGEITFLARLSGQAVHDGGMLASARLDAYVRRLEPEPTKDLVDGDLHVDGDQGSLPSEVVSLSSILTPGRYRLWVGVRKEGGVSVHPPTPLAVGSGASEGKWSFQFSVKEGP